MSIPDDCLFHEGHLWCRPADDGTLVIGISDYAQNKLGEILFLDLPEIGDQVERGVAMGTVESTKVVNDLISPVSGTVKARNDTLDDHPGLANREPYGSGWLVRLEPSTASGVATDGLMNASTYRRYSGV